MSMLHHQSTERSPADRGAGLGRAHAEAVRGAVEAYERLFQAAVGIEPATARDMGGAVGTRLAAGPFASIAEEIEGIAHGAGLDAERVFALNARSEILGPAFGPECSVIGALPRMVAGGACLLAQNWDYQSSVRPFRMLWEVRQPDGRSFTTFTEAGMVAKIGLNSDGLAVAVNMLSSSADRGPEGTPVHVVLRAILQDGRTLADGLALALQTELGASMCFTLAYAQAGDEALMASVERSPDSWSVLWPDEHGWLVHTNHFLERTEHEDLLAVRYPGTLARHWELTDRLRRRPPGSLDAEAIHALFGSHLGGPDGVCCHRDAGPWTEHGETLASIVMDVGARTLAVTDGSPCTAPFTNASELMPELA